MILCWFGLHWWRRFSRGEEVLNFGKLYSGDMRRCKWCGKAQIYRGWLFGDIWAEWF